MSIRGTTAGVCSKALRNECVVLIIVAYVVVMPRAYGRALREVRRSCVHAMVYISGSAWRVPRNVPRSLFECGWYVS